MKTKKQFLIFVLTGGIAAYKTPNLVRCLIKSGCEVKVVMTESAKDFVTPLSLSTVSKNPVYSSFKSDDEDGVWNNHVDLGLWADFMLICPATANTLFKMANGNCDNLLLGVYLSCKSQVFFAPAMDLDMYKHQSTKESINKLISYGNILIPPAYGELASGLLGEGRLPEPLEIVDFIEKFYSKSLSLTGKKVLISAGPTIEELDPVRFISNNSSGKMGFALAEAASKSGADVTLITGPVSLECSNKILRIDVKTAAEMYVESKKYIADADIFIGCAAVADYSPVIQNQNKIKKSSSKDMQISLKKNIDIIASLSKEFPDKKFMGFCAETEKIEEHAKVKLVEKGLDFIVANDVSKKDIGFDSDFNEISVFTKESHTHFQKASKNLLAVQLINMLSKNNQSIH